MTIRPPANGLLQGSGLGNFSVARAERYVTNKGFKAAVPGTTIAAITKVYTVPAGFMAVVDNRYTNPTGGAITLNVYLMEDSVTTPVAADRYLSISAAANNQNTAGQFALDEGGSIWAWASVDASLNYTPSVILIPRPPTIGSWMVDLLKNLAAADTQVYPISPAVIPAGNWAVCPMQGYLHNTTAGAITVLTKIQRVGDVAPFTITTVSVAANGQSAWMGGFPYLLGPLEAGDVLFISPAAVGINFSYMMCERAI